MSWGSSWFKSSWFARWLDSANGAYGAATSIVIVTTAVVVTVSNTATPTAVGVTVTSPAVTVTTDANVATSPSVVTLVSGVYALEIGCDVTSTRSTATLTSTPVTVAIGSDANGAHDTVTVVSPNVSATGDADADALHDTINVVSTDVTVTSSVHYVDTPSIVALTSTNAPVYADGSVYVLPGPSMVKIYVPEIMAFSTDVTTDMQVVEAMATDFGSIDGTQIVKLVRKTDNPIINYTTGQVTVEEKVYTFNEALIRKISARDNKSVQVLRVFMQSVQDDEVATIDTAIELPMRTDVEIMSGDLIYCDMLASKYVVVGIDTCTLKTRWRVGARRLQ